MRIAFCDDSMKEQARFRDMLHSWDPTKEAECFSNGAALLKAAEQAPVFDIVFLDIYMENENGVKVAGKLQELSPGTGIVFVTTSPDYAVEAFSLHALHYFVKPVTEKGIAEAFRRLKQLLAAERPMITLRAERENYTVYLDEICYIRSANHAKEIYLTDGQRIRVWMSMEELEAKLDKNFLKLDRGTIVNMEHIRQMGNDTCILQGGIRMQFPRRERSAIRAAYDSYLFSRLSERTDFDGEVIL